MQEVEPAFLFKQMENFLNPTKLGANTWDEVSLGQRGEDEGLVERVRREEREKLRRIKMRSKRDATKIKGKQGVMYINLDGGGGGEQCPSTADSSAVSLSQMAFLSMAVSIFSTVANIANNLNNNNNNQNDNNLNFVNQQNNNLNMNQNIINQLNIDLPPPVPGRRKRSGPSDRCEGDWSGEVAMALMDVLKVGISVPGATLGDRSTSCLGRHLCQSSLLTTASGLQERIVTLHSLMLAFMQLADSSPSFSRFLSARIKGGELNCAQLFPQCAEL